METCRERFEEIGWGKKGCEREMVKKKKTDLRTGRFSHFFISFLTDKPSDENMCQCENVVMFQNQVTEKLKSLVQNNILSYFRDILTFMFSCNLRQICLCQTVLQRSSSVMREDQCNCIDNYL